LEDFEAKKRLHSAVAAASRAAPIVAPAARAAVEMTDAEAAQYSALLARREIAAARTAVAAVAAAAPETGDAFPSSQGMRCAEQALAESAARRADALVRAAFGRLAMAKRDVWDRGCHRPAAGSSAWPAQYCAN
jgi:hypothetical protein